MTASPNSGKPDISIGWWNTIEKSLMLFFLREPFRIQFALTLTIWDRSAIIRARMSEQIKSRVPAKKGIPDEVRDCVMFGRLSLLVCFGVVLCQEMNGVRYSIDAMKKPAMLAQRPTRIVGGKNTEKGQHPWQVSVHWGSRKRQILPRHVCGGSLLTAGWVLTAGHCETLAPRGGEFLALVGKYKLGILEDTEQSSLVEKVFVYPEYNGTVAPYDIALMKLKNAFKLNPFVATVSLPYPGAIPFGQVTLTGWGSIGRTRAPEHPEILQEALLPIIDYDLCKSTLDKVLRRGKINPLHPTNVCTGPLDGSLSACKGDSGGPLVRMNEFNQVEVVGIVSWGLFPCGGKNAPSVYTRVSAYIPWISLIMLNF